MNTSPGISIPHVAACGFYPNVTRRSVGWNLNGVDPHQNMCHDEEQVERVVSVVRWLVF